MSKTGIKPQEGPEDHGVDEGPGRQIVADPSDGPDAQPEVTAGEAMLEADDQPGPPAAALAQAAETKLQRHPNLGLAPVDMSAGFPEAARRISAEAPAIAARALESAVEADETLGRRFDQAGLRHLLRDAEILTERLAMCVASGDSRFLLLHVETTQPIYRRRGTSLRDIAALCLAIGRVLEPDLGPEEVAAMRRSLDGAISNLRASSRLAGDSHSRNALWDWMYKGV